MHKNVEILTNARRERSIRKHIKATNIITPSFAVGDFVLVRSASNRAHKLSFKWQVPIRVTGVHGQLVYGVTSLSLVERRNVYIALGCSSTTIRFWAPKYPRTN